MACHSAHVALDVPPHRYTRLPILHLPIAFPLHSLPETTRHNFDCAQSVLLTSPDPTTSDHCPPSTRPPPTWRKTLDSSSLKPTRPLRAPPVASVSLVDEERNGRTLQIYIHKQPMPSACKSRVRPICHRLTPYPPPSLPPSLFLSLSLTNNPPSRPRSRPSLRARRLNPTNATKRARRHGQHPN
jgi:hypothetical protein